MKYFPSQEHRSPMQSHYLKMGLLAGLSMLFVACASLNKDKDQNASELVTEAPVVPQQQLGKQQLDEFMQKDPFLRSQIDIEMSAKWARPGIVQLVVMNKT